MEQVSDHVLSHSMFCTPCSNVMILSYVEEKAKELHFTPGQMGARLMGRWQSGKFQSGSSTICQCRSAKFELQMS